MKISIIVTAYKESETINRCLDSITSQSLPDRYEILVSSPDESTINAVKNYQKNNKNIKLVRDPGRGKPVALNILFKKARGDILVLTDGDVILGENSIKNLLRHFKNEKVGAVSGKVIYEVPEDSLFFEWAKFSEKFFDKMRKTKSGERSLYHPTGYLYAIRNNIVGTIPENSFSDDAVVGYLIVSNGYSIEYEPKSKVYVKFPLTVTDFIKQKSRTKAGFLQIKEWFNFEERNMLGELSFGTKDLFKFYGFNKIHKMFLVGLIYFLSWLKAYWIFLGKKEFEEVWSRVESTKY
jgi:cellulose synthase/poly-beta-1,6-N-acetylglucosamine synthase-like glycosyltransferase